MRQSGTTTKVKKGQGSKALQPTPESKWKMQLPGLLSVAVTNHSGIRLADHQPKEGDRVTCKRDAHAFRKVLERLGAGVIYIEQCNQM